MMVEYLLKTRMGKFWVVVVCFLFFCFFLLIVSTFLDVDSESSEVPLMSYMT